MQQFFSLLSWRLFTAQNVSGVFPPIVRSSMTAVAASGFTFVSWWQSCCVRGRAGRPDHEQQHCYHHAPKVKPEATTAVVELLMMGVRTPETCWGVSKHQVKYWGNCCIRLVIHLNRIWRAFDNLIRTLWDSALFFCLMWFNYRVESF